MTKFHCWNLPIAIGESSKSSTDEATNVFGSLVGSSPDATAQSFGMSSVTRARLDVAPTKYMNECRSPTRPTVSERNGLYADRKGDVSGGRRIRYFTISSPPGASTRHKSSS